MGYLSKGYYTVCFSPAFSLFIFVFVSMLLAERGGGWLDTYKVRTGVHTLVIGVQVCGIGLYLVGYKKEKTASMHVPAIKFFSILLILWGLLVTWVAIGYGYISLIRWSRLPEVRELTIWDHLQHATWALKGLLWIASGLTFIATFMHAKRVSISSQSCMHVC